MTKEMPHVQIGKVIGNVKYKEIGTVGSLVVMRGLDRGTGCGGGIVASAGGGGGAGSGQMCRALLR